MPDDTGEVAVHAPPLVGWYLVALGGLTGGCCLLRLCAGLRTGRRQPAGEALMGLGMAAMSLPVGAVREHPLAQPVFAVVFAVAAGHGLVHARTGGVRLHHLLGCLSMVYMTLAMPGPGAVHAGTGPAHPGGGGVPLLTGLLLAYYAVLVLRYGLLLAPAGAAPAVRAPAEAGAAGRCAGPLPELARAGRLSMAIGMFTMLLAL
ncbi:DUF5134 domain-containing protein [Streptomyces meridianus]|uniref:DUF5134 domain-containing protein n=1 Tax=Streptomyces meridianus TaxID=2938945 RepID=A0ABT0XBA6_9ACTN|nr:DUF5134 domain-containing protein [Streptomyces meridianus]MCM2579811.1 DUF5134 domain-containing protein [Streptomyces meridianus]